MQEQLRDGICTDSAEGATSFSPLFLWTGAVGNEYLKTAALNQIWLQYMLD